MRLPLSLACCCDFIFFYLFFPFDFFVPHPLRAFTPSRPHPSLANWFQFFLEKICKFVRVCCRTRWPFTLLLVLQYRKSCYVFIFCNLFYLFTFATINKSGIYLFHCLLARSPVRLFSHQQQLSASRHPTTSFAIEFIEFIQHLFSYSFCCCSESLLPCAAINGIVAMLC